MDLINFLEKDIVTYLDNAVKFGTKNSVTGQYDVDALLSKKDMDTSSQDSSTQTLNSSTKTTSITSDAIKTTSPDVSVKAENVVVQNDLPPTPEPPKKITPQVTEKFVETKAIKQELKAELKEKENELSARDDMLQEEITKLKEKTIRKEKKKSAPALVKQSSKQESISSSPHWFKELAKKETERQKELDEIIILDDTLNNIINALDQHDVTTAKMLYDAVLKKTNAIKYHAQEKISLLSKLKQFDDQITATRQFTAKQREEEKQDKKETLKTKTSLPTNQPSLATKAKTKPDEQPFTSKKDVITTTLNKPISNEASILSRQLDLPPGFTQEETNAVYDYARGVKALQNKNKIEALEIFLHLIKERPKNLAIKIRLQEAVELP